MIILNFSSSIILKNCCKFIIITMNRHSKLNQINHCVTNVKAFMHLNTHFIEFEFLNHNSVKPLENTLSTLLGIGFYIVFLICI